MASGTAASTPVVTYELPTFKGVPGWEFTPLDKFDLEAFPVAEGGAPSAAAPVLAPAGAVEMNRLIELQMEGSIG